MVLFLFVIMLLGVDRGDDLRERLVAQRPLALALAAAFVIEGHRGAGGHRVRYEGSGRVRRGERSRQRAGRREVLFRDYFLPFEVTSVLPIIAAVATMAGASEGPRGDAGRAGGDARMRSMQGR